jgi:hypothetical protein
MFEENGQAGCMLRSWRMTGVQIGRLKYVNELFKLNELQGYYCPFRMELIISPYCFIYSMHWVRHSQI